MEFIAQTKSWWITLGETKRAGVANMGASLTFNGDILTFEDRYSWTVALAEHNVDPKNIFDDKSSENEIMRLLQNPNKRHNQQQMQGRR
jgi:hypothetical protein